MQLTPRYLVKNITTLVADVAGFNTEYRPVYSKQLQVYKGIDNVLEFKLVNADQKPMDLTNYTPKFVAFDENNAMVLEKDGIVLQETDSTVITNKGLFTVTITENELLNVKQQYLKYNVYMQEINGDKVLTYSHANFDNDATIYVNSRVFPGPLESYVVTTFQQDSIEIPIWYSETVNAQPAINGNEALHTAAVYATAYEGTVVVQATLDNQVSDGTSWADIATVHFDGSELVPQPVNFNGVFSYLRFRADADPVDKIFKILVRN